MHCVAYGGRVVTPPVVNAEQKDCPFPPWKAHKQLSALQPGAKAATVVVEV